MGRPTLGGRDRACKIVASRATSKGMGHMNRLLLFSFFIICFVIVTAGLGFGQTEPGPEEDGHEVQVWAGGGHSVPGGTSNTGIFDVGLRYGWVITGPHLPWVLRGRFEYAVDAEPAYLDRKSTRLNSSHSIASRMPSSA